MSGQQHAPGNVRPHYATTVHGQLRLHLAGDGQAAVVLVGPTQSAAWVAGRLGEQLPGRRVVAVEMPGCGGSARVSAQSTVEAAEAIVEALAWLRDEPTDLVVLDLATAFAPIVAAALRPTSVVLADLDSARGWTAQGVVPPSADPRTDGSHLLALWTFLRDRRLALADDAALARSTGPALPAVPELSDGFVAAATDPHAFADWWQRATSDLEAAVKELADATGAADLDAVPAALAGPVATHGVPAPDLPTGPPPTAPESGNRVWHQYVETALGRAHVRRSGNTGRPVMVLPTGGGSAQQFAPVVQGLAVDRTVAALDYFGNGLSESRNSRPDIADLAKEALVVADALGWEELDVWGSHTGACVALEMAVAAPERVGRVVLEAPPMIEPDFRDELLRHYFPDLSPDRFGSHLPRAWAWRRDAFLYWPWYSVDQDSARDIGLPSAQDLHLYAVGILESGETYAGAYRAAFSYDTRGRLPLLRRPAILTAGPHDMLANTLDDAPELVPDGLLEVTATPATVWWPDPEPAAFEQTMRIYREFLG